MNDQKEVKERKEDQGPQTPDQKHTEEKLQQAVKGTLAKLLRRRLKLKGGR